MAILVFLVELKDSKPLVWRRITVPDDYTFYQFHLAIQASFGQEDSHLFQFSKNGFHDNVNYAVLDSESNQDPDFVTKNAKRVKVETIFSKTDSFTYIYHFGDNWEHTIKLDAIIDDEIEIPYCVEGSGNCPPEDCGGIEGYACLVECINTPNHKNRKEYAQWLGLRPGDKWDVEHFSIRDANKRLKYV